MSVNEYSHVRGALVLETGEVFWGSLTTHKDIPFRAKAGEVVFNTSHSGYEEVATDPSYFSQIVLMTAPQQGNYGADSETWESRKIWIEGFICLQIQNSERDLSWQKRLLENHVPLLSQIDTRALTLRLRSGGTVWGATVQAENEAQARDLAGPVISKGKEKDKDWVFLTSRTAIEKRQGQNPQGPKAVVLDFGCKENILRELQQQCKELVILPSRTSAEDVMAQKPDFVMLTNGPGDPDQVQVAPATVQKLIGQVPIFGICMGHQILGLALGAKTYKLKFGHRGSNHPIKDQVLNKIYITSQNHGYAIEASTLPKDVLVTHTNLNDQTVAGIQQLSKKIFSVQFHPESCPGPHEASELFSYFVKSVI
ncbi:MAG: glutamine-hydrolyzing carbamoyl-phosphate synthase small subunit [Pseudobdellovibrionaceae bacterium]